MPQPGIRDPHQPVQFFGGSRKMNAAFSIAASRAASSPVIT